MSPTLQEQIDALDQTITDLESSPSGVLAYLTQHTLDEYDRTVNTTITYYDEAADELDAEIVAASGEVRIFKMGVMIEAAQN